MVAAKENAKMIGVHNNNNSFDVVVYGTIPALIENYSTEKGFFLTTEQIIRKKVEASETQNIQQVQKEYIWSVPFVPKETIVTDGQGKFKIIEDLKHMQELIEKRKQLNQSYKSIDEYNPFDDQKGIAPIGVNVNALEKNYKEIDSAELNVRDLKQGYSSKEQAAADPILKHLIKDESLRNSYIDLAFKRKEDNECYKNILGASFELDRVTSPYAVPLLVLGIGEYSLMGNQTFSDGVMYPASLQYRENMIFRYTSFEDAKSSQFAENHEWQLNKR